MSTETVEIPPERAAEFMQAIASLGLDAPATQRPAPAERPRAYTNEQMRIMLESLSGVLDRADLIGYAAARNTRALRDCAAEYLARVDALAREYGEPVLDGEGNPTGAVVVPFESPRFAEFEERMAEWGGIEHEPDLYRIPVSEAIGKLSGTQMLALDWMFEEGL